MTLTPVFPLPIRSRGIALSTASNWLWNTVSRRPRIYKVPQLILQIIAVITPYMVGTGKGQGNLGPHVFFIWGGLCTCALIYTFFLVPETKGLSLEQVDRMLEETTPRTSARWKPTTTYAAEGGMTERYEGKDGLKTAEEHIEGSVPALSA
mgnify:FL=1|jgi:hypothetical protein